MSRAAGNEPAVPETAAASSDAAQAAAVTGNWRRWVVTFGGAGLSPVAPGTVGSLAATLLLVLLSVVMQRAGRPPGGYDAVWNALLAAGVLAFGGVCVALGRWTNAHFAKKDPGPCVLDEAAGICLAALFVPIYPAGSGYWTLLGAFAAFRVFDITKLPPARQLEKLPGGWGILLDDLAAAVYANVFLQVLFRVTLA